VPPQDGHPSTFSTSLYSPTPPPFPPLRLVVNFNRNALLLFPQETVSPPDTPRARREWNFWFHPPCSSFRSSVSPRCLWMKGPGRFMAETSLPIFCGSTPEFLRPRAAPDLRPCVFRGRLRVRFCATLVQSPRDSVRRGSPRGTASPASSLSGRRFLPYPLFLALFSFLHGIVGFLGLFRKKSFTSIPQLPPAFVQVFSRLFWTLPL